MSGYNQGIVDEFFRIEFLCRCIFLKKTARFSRGNFAYGAGAGRAACCCAGSGPPESRRDQLLFLVVIATFSSSETTSSLATARLLLFALLKYGKVTKYLQ